MLSIHATCGAISEYVVPQPHTGNIRGSPGSGIALSHGVLGSVKDALRHAHQAPRAVGELDEGRPAGIAVAAARVDAYADQVHLLRGVADLEDLLGHPSLGPGAGAVELEVVQLNGLLVAVAGAVAGDRAGGPRPSLLDDDNAPGGDSLQRYFQGRVRWGIAG